MLQNTWVTRSACVVVPHAKMFKSKSHGDIKKSSQKVLDYKKDILARLKHLKIVIETLETQELKAFFDANFSHVYFIFYEVFVQIEVERRQKGYRIHKDDFEFLLVLFEKILVLLPNLVQKRWQFHSIGRIMKKLLHSGNSIKVRRDGVRLFVMWYQILQENNSTESHAIFSRLAQITTTDSNYFSFSDHGQATSENPVCASELSAVQPPSSIEKGPEKECVYFLELLLTFIVSEVSKIEWINPVQKQECFIFLFESFKRYYMPVIFPSFEQRATIYGASPNLSTDKTDKLGDGYVDHGEPASASQLEDCRDVVVRWFTNFVQMSRLQQSDEPSVSQADRTSAGVKVIEDVRDSGAGVTGPGFSLGPTPVLASSGSVIDRQTDEGVSTGYSSRFTANTAAVESGSPRTSAVAPTASLPAHAQQPTMVAAANQASPISDGSDANDSSSSSSSDDGAESLPGCEPHDYSQHEIVRSVLFGTRENVDIIHEVFRQAFMLPMRLAGGIRRVVAVYKEWLQMPVHRPIFLRDPVSLSGIGGGKQTRAADANSLASPAEHDLAEVRAGRQRPHSYIAAVKWESGGGGSSIGRDGLSIRAGLRNSVLLFIQHSSCVFEKEPAGEPLPVQVKLCLQVLNLYRYIVMKLNIDQQTWEQLLRVLLRISTALLGEASHNLDLAKELAGPVLQTLIVTWIKANLYVYISAELWDSLLDTLSALTSWRELIAEWAKTMDTLTRILAKHVYKLDLTDLPLDRMSESKSRRLRHTSLVPALKEKKTATFSRAYSGLDNSGTMTPNAQKSLPAIAAMAAPAIISRGIDGSACTEEEDEFACLANRRHKSTTDAQTAHQGDSTQKQQTSGSSNLFRLPRSNSDGNIADSLERQRGTNATPANESAQHRSSLAPSRSTPPAESRSSDGSGSLTSAAMGGSSGQPIPLLPPPLPARPKLSATLRVQDVGPPPPLIPPPPLPPPPRVAKRHAPELGPDPSPGIESLPSSRRSKDAMLPGQGGSSSGEPSPSVARRRLSPARAATISVEVSKTGSSGSNSLTYGLITSSAASNGTSDFRGALPNGKCESHVTSRSAIMSGDSSIATTAGACANESTHSRHTSDREDSLIQMDFTTPWLNQEVTLEDGYSASTHETWSSAAVSTTATASALADHVLGESVADAAAVAATVMLPPDEEMSMASTDDYRPLSYDLIVDTELGASSTVSLAGGNDSSTGERTELQALIGAGDASSQSAGSSSPTSSGQLFDYMHAVDDETVSRGGGGAGGCGIGEATGTTEGSQGSLPMYTPPSSPHSLHPGMILDSGASSRPDIDGSAEVNFKLGTPDRESLHIDETSQDLPGLSAPSELDTGDRRSVVLGGQQRGWMPATSVVLWRRMLGILGNPNTLSSTSSHAAVFDYLLELLTVILKIADNQGVVVGSQQATQPPPEVTAPVLFLAPICFKAQEMGEEYKAGKLVALQMLCMMTLRHVYTPPTEGHLIQFYLTVHSGLISNDQELVNVLVKYLSPYLFGLDLPGSTMLIMDVINAAGSVVSLAAVKEAPRKEGVTLLGSLVCFPNHYGETPVLYEEQSGLCPLPSKHMKDCLMELLTTSAKTEPLTGARCIALSSLGIYLVEELLAGTCHESIKEVISVLLLNLKNQTPAAVSHVACDVLCILSEHISALRKIKAELPAWILTKLVALLTEQVAAAPDSDENLVVSLMFCILHWCMALDLKELLAAPVTSRSGNTASADDSLLRRVFAALYPTAIKREQQAQQHSNAAVQQDSDESGASQHHGNDASPAQLPGSTGADVTDHGFDSFGSSGQVQHSMLGETERVQAAAKFVVCHLVNHLGNYPVESETQPVLSTVQEQHDLALPDTDSGVLEKTATSSDDLTAAIFSSPGLQVFVYNGSTLISCMEIEKRDIDLDSCFVSTSTTTRILVRDITGKYCWNAALMYGQPKVLPVHELDSSTLRLSNFASPTEREALDSLDMNSNFSRTTDELAQVLQSITEVAPECQLIPGLALDLPYPPADEMTAQLEDDIVEQLLRQQSDDNQYYAEHKGDFRMTAGTEEAPIYQEQEPIAAFLQSRQYLHQFGFLSWENRQKVDLLHKSDRLLRELKNLDNQLRSRETHKIAVIYVAEGQEDKRAVLGNSAGSERFEHFVAGLGWEVDLRTHKGFMGGLQRDGKTGDTAPYYATATVEVLYHVSTRMPGATDDDQHRKLKHLGNDEVHIVWSEHYREFRRGIISTEFGDALIIIYPLQSGLYRVRIDKKPEVPFFGPLFDGAIVSRRTLPSLVRATAINASRQHRLTLPHFHPFFVQRARSIQKIAQECRKPTTFEAFAASVFSPGLVLPSPGGNDSWDLSSFATGSSILDGETHFNYVDTATAPKKDGSQEPSVTMRAAMRMLSVKRGRSLLQRRHTEFGVARSSPPPSPTSPRKK